MKRLIIAVMLVAFACTIAYAAADVVTYESKKGNVTFDHKAHNELAENGCETCHESIFPKSREPINYKDKMHKTAEAEKTSCATCHHAGGESFETKGNCKKCHVK